MDRFYPESTEQRGTPEHPKISQFPQAKLILNLKVYRNERPIQRWRSQGVESQCCQLGHDQHGLLKPTGKLKNNMSSRDRFHLKPTGELNNTRKQWKRTSKSRRKRKRNNKLRTSKSLKKNKSFGFRKKTKRACPARRGSSRASGSGRAPRAGEPRDLLVRNEKWNDLEKPIPRISTPTRSSRFERFE